MTLEELDRALTHSNITRIPQPEIVGLNRDHGFVIDGIYYRLEWWSNMIYLHAPASKLMVAATRCEQNGNWPNHARINLAFYYEDKTVAVIELEQYGEAQS